MSRRTGRPIVHLSSIPLTPFSIQPFDIGGYDVPADMPDYVPDNGGFVTVVPNDWFWGNVMVSHEPFDVVQTGTEVNISALPNTWDAYFEFERWEVLNGDVVVANPHSAETTFTMPDEDVFITAIFRPQDDNALISVVINNENMGDVWMSHGVQMPGNYVSLQAFANYADGAYEFSDWEVLSGDVMLSTNNDLSFTYFEMPENDVSIRAVFQAIANPVSVEALSNNAEWGWAYASPQVTTTGEVVTVTAVPMYGMDFSHWQIVSGDIAISDFYDITSPEILFFMPDTDVSFRAVFQTMDDTSLINVESNNTSWGSAFASELAAATDDVIYLTAVPSDGMRLGTWEVLAGNVVIDNPASPNTFFVMPNGDVSIRAVFMGIEETLTIPTVIAHPGEEVELTLYVGGNPGFANMPVRLDFPDELTLIRYDLASDSIPGILHGPQDTVQGYVCPVGMLSPVYLNWVNANNFTADGEFITLTFALAPDIAVGIYDITAEFRDIHRAILPMNRMGTPVEFEIVDGYVEITGWDLVEFIETPAETFRMGVPLITEAIVIEALENRCYTDKNKIQTSSCESCYFKEFS